MIGQVNRGDKITSSKTNEIITGLNSITNNTSNNYGGYGKKNPNPTYPCLFQIKSGIGYKMKNRPNEYEDNPPITMDNVWILLGDLDEVNRNCGTSKIYLLNLERPELQGEVLETWVKRNGDDYFYDGWVDCQWSDRHTSVYACILTGVNLSSSLSSESEEEEKTSDILVISPTDDDDKIYENLRAIDPNLESCKISNKICLAKWTEPGYLQGTSSSTPKFQQMIQYHVGSLVASGSSEQTPKPFDIENGWLVRPYYMVGDILQYDQNLSCQVSDFTNANQYAIGLKIRQDISGSGQVSYIPQVVGYYDLDAMMADQKDYDYSVIPLYLMDKNNQGKTIEVDLRNTCPRSQRFEFLNDNGGY